MATSKDLVKMVDNGGNSPVVFEKMGELKSVLNQEPNKAWVKNHPYAHGVVYLPIDKVETMLDMIFQQWRVEILSISQLAQSICCTIRLHYLNPITKEWSYHDGVGAVPLKTDKGFSAADLSHILRVMLWLLAHLLRSLSPLKMLQNTWVNSSVGT